LRSDPIDDLPHVKQNPDRLERRTNPNEKDWARDKEKLMARSNSQKLAIAFLLVGAFLAAAIYALTRPLHDFVEYWTAAHIVLKHGNPYSLNEMFREQQNWGWKQLVPLMFLSPPWALVFIAPLGLTHSYATAWLLWTIAMAAVVALSSRLLMDVYFDKLRIPEISDTAFYRCLFAFTFYPVLLCFKFAQTAPLMLLGLAGFLWCESKNRSVIAGAALSLTLIKPQLLYLVWIALLFKSIQQCQWKILTSAASVIVGLTVSVVILDPKVISQYWELALSPYAQVIPSGITTPIRRLLGGSAFWIQLIPPCIGLAWLGWYWRQHRLNWSWRERMPTLVTVSVLTSAYGWIFDETVLVLPVIAMAAKAANVTGSLPKRAIVLYTALNCILMLVMGYPPVAFLPAPVFVAVLLWQQRKTTTPLIVPVLAK
jgi:Glycosyltransferase family 87